MTRTYDLDQRWTVYQAIDFLEEEHRKYKQACFGELHECLVVFDDRGLRGALKVYWDECRKKFGSGAEHFASSAGLELLSSQPPAEACTLLASCASIGDGTCSRMYRGVMMIA